MCHCSLAVLPYDSQFGSSGSDLYALNTTCNSLPFYLNQCSVSTGTCNGLPLIVHCEQSEQLCNNNAEYLSVDFIMINIACNNGEVRLVNHNVSYPEVGGGADVGGVVEICFDGKWAAACNSVNTNLTSDVLGAVCKTLGYSGKSFP